MTAVNNSKGFVQADASMACGAKLCDRSSCVHVLFLPVMRFPPAMIAFSFTRIAFFPYQDCVFVYQDCIFSKP